MEIFGIIEIITEIGSEKIKTTKTIQQLIIIFEK